MSMKLTKFRIYLVAGIECETCKGAGEILHSVTNCSDPDQYPEVCWTCIGFGREPYTWKHFKYDIQELFKSKRRKEQDKKRALEMESVSGVPF